MKPAETNIPRTLYKYLFSCFLLTLAIRLLLSGYHNSSLGGIEQNVIYGIQRLLLGQDLYQNPSLPPYAVMQYTPLYYYLIAGLARLSSIGATDVQEIYVLCRSMALLFNILTVALVALTIRTWQLSWLCAFGFAMPVLMVLTTHYYTRGDSMHLFFFAAALYAYVLHSQRKGLRDIIAAAVCSAGCIMTKQSGILIIGIISFCMLVYEHKRRAWLLYILCTAGIAYLVADAANNGNWQAFYQNTCLGLKNGIDPSFLYLIFTSQFFMDMVPCYVLGAIAAWLAAKHIKDKTFRIIATGAVLSFVFAVVTGLKIGSSNNYFMEFLLCLLIALPYLLLHYSSSRQLFKLSKRQVTIRGLGHFALLVLVTSKTVGLFSAVFIEGSVKDTRGEYEQQQALHAYMKEKLDTTGYIFFTDRSFFDNIFIDRSIMSTKDVVNQTYTADPTTFDYSGWPATARNIRYIVITKDRPDINTWHPLIHFIHFDTAEWKLAATYKTYAIYSR